MEVLREREVKNSLERQLAEEQRHTLLCQKRLRKERKMRRRLQDELDLETKRRSQLEEALKATSDGGDTIRRINDKLNEQQRSNSVLSVQENSEQSSQQKSLRRASRSESPVARQRSPYVSVSRDSMTPVTHNEGAQPPKGWNYSGLDLVNSGGGTAFWQNYSDSLAQELEMERKSRQQDRADVKSPLQQERANYYKNSVLFSSAT